MSFFDHPEVHTRKNAYFAALNSHRGFVSYFPSLFAPYRKLVIKGGPGSGKSTLMKKIAHAAEERGYQTVHYYCSSDTSSLDAVAVPELHFVILDGTPPHTTEPDCPGAVDSLVDLTAFWNTSLLQERANTIGTLNREISETYRRAYSLMKGIFAIETAITQATEHAFDDAHAEKIIARLFEKYHITKEGDGKAILRPASAFGVKGYLALDSYEKEAETIIHIKDRIIYSEHFFKILQKALLQKGVSFYISPRPVDEVTDSIFLPKQKILLTRNPVINCPDGTVNLDRMLPERGRGALAGQKGLLREMDALCLATKELLCHAGKRHDELESHYIAATDYAALNHFTQKLISSLFS